METYIGTKLIKAEPLNLGDYNTKRGWTIPANEDPKREGYFVEYSDGYQSWSPKEVFEEAYRQIASGQMTFGQAVEAAKKGFKVERKGWNGKGMFAFHVNGSKFTVNRAPLNEIYPDGTEVEYRPHIDLKAVDGTIGVWNPNMMDILAEDWQIV